MSSELAAINRDFANTPQGLVEWALAQGARPICTTNFRPFEAVILHMVSQVRPDIPIVWMDSGYNTEATYQFADDVINQLNLNIVSFVPRRTRAHREALDGHMPGIDDPRHAAFTQEVKLEPFGARYVKCSPTYGSPHCVPKTPQSAQKCSRLAAIATGC